MRKIYRIIALLSIIIISSLSLTFFGCSEGGNPSNNNNPPGTLQPVDLLPASDEISGWDKGTGPGDFGLAEDENSLYALINGASEDYIANGFVQGVNQVYYGTTGGAANEAAIFIADQGDSANVAALFDEEQVVPTNLTAWDYGDEAGINETLPFDYEIFVRCDKFFIRVTIGRSVNEVEALNTAKFFAMAVVDDIES